MSWQNTGNVWGVLCHACQSKSPLNSRNADQCAFCEYVDAWSRPRVCRESIQSLWFKSSCSSRGTARTWSRVPDCEISKSRGKRYLIDLLSLITQLTSNSSGALVRSTYAFHSIAYVLMQYHRILRSKLPTQKGSPTYSHKTQMRIDSQLLRKIQVLDIGQPLREISSGHSLHMMCFWSINERGSL